MIDGQMVDVKIHPPAWQRSAWPPERVLADCDAKRRIIELSEFLPGAGAPWGEPVLRMLALPYADRPGYRDEWRADTPT